jgi:hypothetical protein
VLAVVLGNARVGLAEAGGALSAASADPGAPCSAAIVPPTSAIVCSVLIELIAICP